MPKPRPLRPDETNRTLVGRFERGRDGGPGLADKLRQLHTKFGARSRRLFLVWVKWTGDERGEGTEQVVRELEVLPTPKVSELTAISRNPFSAGMLPVGSLRIDEISASFSEETLRGRMVPGQGPVPEPYDFFFETREDGRGGEGEPLRQRYRLLAGPARKETNISWSIVLERASGERKRDGSSSIGPDFLLER